MRNLFLNWKRQIEEILSAVQIEHIGGSSIQGAKTKGDLDISVQTSEINFASDCEKMKQIAHIHHPELWAKDFAIFNMCDQSVKIDIMLVVKGSDYDTFTKTRDILISNPTLLAEYNLIKDKLTPRTPEYHQAKKAFFSRILAGK